MTSTAPRLVGDAIRQSLRNGDRPGQIAQRYGVSRETVNYHRRAIGLPPRVAIPDRGPKVRFRRCEGCGGREDVTRPHQHGGLA